MKKYTLKTFLLVSILLMSMVSFVSADVFLSQWGDNVDSGGHLDWEHNTKYYDESVYAMDTWNLYKPGVIREDSIFVVEDIYVGDYYEASDTIAFMQHYDAEIRYNDYMMSGMITAERRHTAIHEFGHALGLGENPTTIGAVMQQGRLTNQYLRDDDKESYDAAAALY